MTLVIALVWGTGILVSADSRVSGGYVIHEEKKIYPVYFTRNDVDYNLAVLAGAGDAALVKQGFYMAENVFREWLDTLDVKRNPSSRELDDIISEIEKRLMSRYRDIRILGLETDTVLLLASVTRRGEPRLYVFDDRGIAEPKHDSPGYALLGRGAVTGGLLLLRLLNYTRKKNWDLGMLSSFIIDVVSEIDPSVSPFLGESLFIRYDPEEKRVILGPLKKEAFKEYKEKIKSRKEAFRLLWEAMEYSSEENIINNLKRL